MGTSIEYTPLLFSNAVPLDIVREIVSLLPRSAMVKCCLVCKAWKREIYKCMFQSIDLSKSVRRIIDDSVISNLAGYENLKRLSLRNCQRITDQGLSALYSNSLKSIEFLDVSGLYRVTDEGLKAIATCHRIQVLDLSGCRAITCAGVDHITLSLQNLQELNLASCVNLSVETINIVAINARNLTALDISELNFPRTDLEIALPPALISLTLGGKAPPYGPLSRSRNLDVASLVPALKLSCITILDCEPVSEWKNVDLLTCELPLLEELSMGFLSAQQLLTISTQCPLIHTLYFDPGTQVFSKTQSSTLLSNIAPFKNLKVLGIYGLSTYAKKAGGFPMSVWKKSSLSLVDLRSRSERSTGILANCEKSCRAKKGQSVLTVKWYDPEAS